MILEHRNEQLGKATTNAVEVIYHKEASSRSNPIRVLR